MVDLIVVVVLKKGVFNSVRWVDIFIATYIIIIGVRS